MIPSIAPLLPGNVVVSAEDASLWVGLRALFVAGVAEVEHLRGQREQLQNSVSCLRRDLVVAEANLEAIERTFERERTNLLMIKDHCGYEHERLIRLQDAQP